MTPEQKAAYINAMAVCAFTEVQSMIAANKEREDKGLSLAYGEEAFSKVIGKYPIYHNAVITFFQD